MERLLVPRTIQAAADDLGVEIIGTGRTIKPGDLYIAERNTGPKLLTCRNVEMGAVFPIEHGYAFDLCECFKVKEY